MNEWVVAISKAIAHLNNTKSRSRMNAPVSPRKSLHSARGNSLSASLTSIGEDEEGEDGDDERGGEGPLGHGHGQIRESQSVRVILPTKHGKHKEETPQQGLRRKSSNNRTSGSQSHISGSFSVAELRKSKSEQVRRPMSSFNEEAGRVSLASAGSENTQSSLSCLSLCSTLNPFPPLCLHTSHLSLTLISYLSHFSPHSSSHRLIVSRAHGMAALDTSNKSSDDGTLCIDSSEIWTVIVEQVGAF